MSRGSSCGTLSSAARITVVARSSGRTSRREPLTARPMGLRAVETMTASGMPSRYPPTYRSVVGNPEHLVTVLLRRGLTPSLRDDGGARDRGQQRVRPHPVPVRGGVVAVVAVGAGVRPEHRTGLPGQVDRDPAGGLDR